MRVNLSIESGKTWSNCESNSKTPGRSSSETIQCQCEWIRRRINYQWLSKETVQHRRRQGDRKVKQSNIDMPSLSKDVTKKKIVMQYVTTSTISSKESSNRRSELAPDVNHLSNIPVEQTTQHRRPQADVPILWLELDLMWILLQPQIWGCISITQYSTNKNTSGWRCKGRQQNSRCRYRC